MILYTYMNENVEKKIFLILVKYVRTYYPARSAGFFVEFASFFAGFSRICWCLWWSHESCASLHIFDRGRPLLCLLRTNSRYFAESGLRNPDFPFLKLPEKNQSDIRKTMESCEKNCRHSNHVATKLSSVLRFLFHSVILSFVLSYFSCVASLFLSFYPSIICTSRFVLYFVLGFIRVYFQSESLDLNTMYSDWGASSLVNTTCSAYNRIQFEKCCCVQERRMFKGTQTFAIHDFSLLLFMVHATHWLRAFYSNILFQLTSALHSNGRWFDINIIFRVVCSCIVSS